MGLNATKSIVWATYPVLEHSCQIFVSNTGTAVFWGLSPWVCVLVCAHYKLGPHTHEFFHLSPVTSGGHQALCITHTNGAHWTLGVLNRFRSTTVTWKSRRATVPLSWSENISTLHTKTKNPPTPADIWLVSSVGKLLNRLPFPDQMTPTGTRTGTYLLQWWKYDTF